MLGTLQRQRNQADLSIQLRTFFPALLVNGEDGTKAMYGFSPYSGNGCCTYIKKLALMMLASMYQKVDGVTMDFNTYYGILKQLAAKKGHYVISAPDFISTEPPYTNYLPEFYQKANYTFYKRFFRESNM